MSRPTTQAEYLASLCPLGPGPAGEPALPAPAVPWGPERCSPPCRSLPPAAAAARPPPDRPAAAEAPRRAVSSLRLERLGRQAQAAYEALMTAFAAKNAGLTAKINTVDHNTFQENINTYLKGAPDDVFTWFAGYRAKYFAARGLTGDISDVWAKISGMSDALKKASTGDDGKQYFVPFTNYPWALFYRKSVWTKHGYAVPKTLDELEDPRRADEEGRPGPDRLRRQGRLAGNGHLRCHQHAGQRLRLPCQPDGRQGGLVRRQGQEGLRHLGRHPRPAPGRPAGPHLAGGRPVAAEGSVGMYLLGSFVAQQFAANEQDDIDFFTFPEVDSTIGADAIDAPIDGFHDGQKPKNEAGAKALLGYLATGPAEDIYPSRTPRSSVSGSSRTPPAIPACRRSRPSSSPRRSRSPSSWTATHAPTSPPR